jgi:hypothetical protein
MRRMQNQSFAEQHQSSQFTRFKNGAFAVLASDDQGNLERRPCTVGALAKSVAQNIGLPRVQDQAG